MARGPMYSAREDQIIAKFLPQGGVAAVLKALKAAGLAARPELSILSRWSRVVRPTLKKQAKSLVPSKLQTSPPSTNGTNKKVWGRTRVPLTATGELPNKPLEPKSQAVSTHNTGGMPVSREPAIEDAALGAMDAVSAAEACLANLRRELALCEESLADLRRLVKQAAGRVAQDGTRSVPTSLGA